MRQCHKSSKTDWKYRYTFSIIKFEGDLPSMASYVFTVQRKRMNSPMHQTQACHTCERAPSKLQTVHQMYPSRTEKERVRDVLDEKI